MLMIDMQVIHAFCEIKYWFSRLFYIIFNIELIFFVAKPSEMFQCQVPKLTGTKPSH